MKITALDMFQLQVADWSAMVDWYRTNFAGEVLFSEPADRFCLMKLGEGGAQLALYGRDGVDLPAVGGRWFPCIQVQDVDALVADCRRKGIAILTELHGSEGYRMATLADPEGNAIHVYAWLHAP